MKSVEQEYKKVTFYVEPEKHARFLIFLKYHDFKVQGDFFRAVVQSCLDDDEKMFKLISKLKEKKVSRRRKKISEKDFNNMKQNIQDYNLSEEEVDDIFSLIAEERGDLWKSVRKNVLIKKLNVK